MTIYTLYVKTHNKTKLKYLGYTTSTNPHKYPGSGTYWTFHLNKYGRDYSTEIIQECQTKEEIKEFGLYYSKLWNIVESDEWANLKEESGDGGRQSAEVRARIGAAGKGRVPWNKGKSGHLTTDQRRRISDGNRTKGPQSAETIAKRVDKTTGKTRTDEQKSRLSEAQKGRVISAEHARKIGVANKGKIPWNTGKTVPYKSTAKMWEVYDAKVDHTYIVYSLREWCKQYNINYCSFHRAIKNKAQYLKRYRAQEI